eukprot:3495463-Prymnesium_polylepis.1
MPTAEDVLASFDEAKAVTATRRGELGQLTKSLRQADDAGRLAQLNKTMKTFQREIERLTERGSYAEEAYRALHAERSSAAGRDSPDPSLPTEESDLEGEGVVGLDALRAALA